MEQFRNFLGKKVILATKNCEPGTTYSGIFYTMNVDGGIFVFRDVIKKTPTSTEKFAKEYVGFKFGDVTSFSLDLSANLPSFAAQSTEPAEPAEEKPKPAAKKEASAAEPESKAESEPAPAAEEKEKEKEEPKKTERKKLSIKRQTAESQPSEEKAEEPSAPATGSKPTNSGEGRQQRGGYRGRGGFKPRQQRTSFLNDSDSVETIKSTDYDLASAAAAFEKLEDTEKASEDHSAYEKDDFFDSLTSETTETHIGRGRGRGRGRGGRGRGGFRGGRGGNYNNHGYYGRGGRGGHRGGFNSHQQTSDAGASTEKASN